MSDKNKSVNRWVDSKDDHRQYNHFINLKFMKTLAELSNDARQYLKEKWSVSIKELEREIRRNGDRLNVRVERQSVNLQTIEEAQERLADAESVLDHLTNTSAPQEMIDRQQISVDKLTEALQDAQYSSGSLTDEEVVLQQSAIDILGITKEYQEQKVQEITDLQQISSQDSQID